MNTSAVLPRERAPSTVPSMGLDSAAVSVRDTTTTE
jgi:hypothetical protein